MEGDHRGPPSIKFPGTDFKLLRNQNYQIIIDKIRTSCKMESLHVFIPCLFINH